MIAVALAKVVRMGAFYSDSADSAW
jgi:hypothetical protein